MRKNKLFALALLTSFLLSTTACGVKSVTAAGLKDYTESTVETAVASTESSSEASKETTNASSAAGTTGTYKDSDYYEDYTTKECTYIGLNGDSANITGKKAGTVTLENGVLTITEKGYYVLEGTFKGTIVVEVPEEDKVHLVLNGATIAGQDGPAIYEKTSDKLIVMLAPGTVNTLTDAADYSSVYEEANADAALYATDDLTINGEGTLNVTGNHEAAVKTKDDLKIMSGTLNISSVDDGLKGNDSLTVADGLITVSAGDDGLHSDGALIIDNGTVNVVKSVEALEGLTITVNGGTVNTVSSDDGMNATSGNSGEFGEFGGFGGGGFRGNFGSGSRERTQMPGQNNGEMPEMPEGNNGEAPQMPEMPAENNGELPQMPLADGNVPENTEGEGTTEENTTPVIVINGGTIYVNAGGDGLDANGNIEMNGGYVYVSGSSNGGNNATDYDGTFLINGGNLIAVGSTGMYQSISAGSSCYAIDFTSQGTLEKGTECVLKDGDTVIYSFTVDKSANAVLLTGDKLEKDKEYTLVTGSTETTVTAKEGSGQGGFGGGFGKGGFGQGNQGEMQGGFGGQGKENRR